MLRRFFVIALALACFAPSAKAQSQPRAIQAGTYDLKLTYGGGLVDATMELGYKGDSVTVVLKLGDHQSPVKPGARTGTKLILEPTSPGMDVRYELDFAGDTVKGKFRFNGEEGAVTGTRRKQGS